MPKNRQVIYCVVRESCIWDNSKANATVLDSFGVYEDALNFREFCIQDYLDRKINGFEFSVQASVFYT
jgi:hypothetical protein